MFTFFKVLGNILIKSVTYVQCHVQETGGFFVNQLQSFSYLWDLYYNFFRALCSLVLWPTLNIMISVSKYIFYCLLNFLLTALFIVMIKVCYFCQSINVFILMKRPPSTLSLYSIRTFNKLVAKLKEIIKLQKVYWYYKN